MKKSIHYYYNEKKFILVNLIIASLLQSEFTKYLYFEKYKPITIIIYRRGHSTGLKTFWDYLSPALQSVIIPILFEQNNIIQKKNKMMWWVLSF